MDLVEGHHAYVRAGVAFQDNGVEIDAEDFRALAIDEMGADDVDIVRRRSRRDTAYALQYIQNGFLALIGNGPLPADDLTHQKNLLALVLDNSDANVACGHASAFGEVASNLRHGMAFHANPLAIAKEDAAIGAYRCLAAEFITPGNLDLEDIGEADQIVLINAVASLLIAVGHQVLFDMAAVAGTTGSSYEKKGKQGKRAARRGTAERNSPPLQGSPG
ncbi:MAG: hypothetical protein FJ271_21660 [Planctomycetes bacterium]|nr:hypothetical protein [Planctomycetota bacterium]